MNSLERFEEKALKLRQVECPVTNIFADGVYWREIIVPAGTVILGHEHKTEHLNVMLSGRIRLMIDGKVSELVAPQVFVSPAGVRKVALALEETRWANVHPNIGNEHDTSKLEDIFVGKSQAFIEHEAELKQLMEEK